MGIGWAGSARRGGARGYIAERKERREEAVVCGMAGGKRGV
jgi:hypothetical protein